MSFTLKKIKKYDPPRADIHENQNAKQHYVQFSYCGLNPNPAINVYKVRAELYIRPLK